MSFNSHEAYAFLFPLPVSRVIYILYFEQEKSSWRASYDSGLYLSLLTNAHISDTFLFLSYPPSKNKRKRTNRTTKKSKKKSNILTHSYHFKPQLKRKNQISPRRTAKKVGVETPAALIRAFYMGKKPIRESEKYLEPATSLPALFPHLGAELFLRLGSK